MEEKEFYSKEELKEILKETEEKTISQISEELTKLFEEYNDRHTDDYFDLIYRYKNKEVLNLTKSIEKTKDFVKTETVVEKFHNNIYGHIKIGKNFSYPVLHKENGTYYLAVFAGLRDMKFIAQYNYFYRPDTWVIADIKTGDIIEKRNSKVKEFSKFSYNKKLNPWFNKNEETEEHYKVMFDILDDVRKKLLETKELDTKKYKEYLNKILECSSDDYKRFYKDLSI